LPPEEFTTRKKIIFIKTKKVQIGKKSLGRPFERGGKKTKMIWGWGWRGEETKDTMFGTGPEGENHGEGSETSSSLRKTGQNPSGRVEKTVKRRTQSQKQKLGVKRHGVKGKHHREKEKGRQKKWGLF